MSIKAEPKAVGKLPLSPPTLIILLVGIVAIVYLQFFTGPAKEAPAANAGRNIVTPRAKAVHSDGVSSTVAQPISSSIDQQQASEPDIQPQDWNAVNRNPFLPPAFVIRSRQMKEATVAPADNSPLVTSESAGAPPQTRPAAPEKTASVDQPAAKEKPVWKGVIATNSGQVALVGYENKTVLLHIGSKLADTDYQLQEIHPQYFLFDSDSGQLKVEKKEATQK